MRAKAELDDPLREHPLASCEVNNGSGLLLPYKQPVQKSLACSGKTPDKDERDDIAKRQSTSKASNFHAAYMMPPDCSMSIGGAPIVRV